MIYFSHFYFCVNNDANFFTFDIDDTKSSKRLAILLQLRFYRKENLIYLIEEWILIVRKRVE